MLTKPQQAIAISWIEDNDLNHDLLQKIVSENSNTINQVTQKYTEQYNNLNKKQLLSPMPEIVLLYIHQLYKTSPNTFHRYSMNIEDDIVYSDKTKINLPELIEKIKNENITLLSERKMLLDKYVILQKKYDDLLKETSYKNKIHTDSSN